MDSGPEPTASSAERVALIHREIFQLGVLIVVAVAAFVFTRTVAAGNRDVTLRDAAEWYRLGQDQLGASRVDDAVGSFRRASVRDRTDKRYVLALAQALTLKQEYDAARAELLTLRESATEDPDVNLQLARIAAYRYDVPEALRFYRTALYALWPPEQVDARRRVRFEVIRFLLAHEQANRAQSELLALATDLPDDVGLHLETAQLFEAAGDHAHALEQFQSVIHLAPNHPLALAGAGRVAFQLGNYSLARTYLNRTSVETNEVRTTRDVVDLVLSNDPLANRLGSAERRRRLVADFSYAQARLAACLTQDAARQATDAELMLQRQTEAFGDQMKTPRPLEQDTVETGVDLVDRVARHVSERCGPATALDQALVLIGRQHGGDTR